MKKVFCILMIIAVLLCFSACSSSLQASSGERSTTEAAESSTKQTSTTAQETQSVTETTPEPSTPETESKALVVYFSAQAIPKQLQRKSHS